MIKRIEKLFAAFVASVMLLSCAGCQQVEKSTAPIGTTSASVSASVTSDNGGQPVESEPIQQTTTAASQSTATSSVSSATSADVIDIPVETGLSVSYTIGNSWKEGGMSCTQIEFTVSNNSGKSIDNWNVEVGLGQNVELMQNWNSAIKTNGSTLTASNAEYNGIIAAGAQVGFGCIVKTPADISALNSIKVNGEPANITTGSSGGGNSSTTAATTATAATTTTTVSKPPSVTEIETTGRYGLVSDIGQLSVKGADLVGADGKPVQLRGISTHGIQWFPQFANKQAFKYLRDEWNINTIRLAMYTGESEGYTNSTKAGIEQTVQNAVDYCIELDMYVIIDWHLLADKSPQVRKADALRFFEYMSKKYASYPNVIYEICNEPNGHATWSGDVKPYAEEVIPVIRKNDPDSVVIVGTPNWSQDIDKALADPLKFDNVMYALHYYSTTHTDWLRNRMKSCYNSGLPIFVSEFGNCAADGNGVNSIPESRKWLEAIDSLNISYINWSLCDKNEAASLLMPGASATGGWTDSNLTESGRFMRDWFKNHD